MSFKWSHFVIFIQSSLVQYWNSKKHCFTSLHKTMHQSPQYRWVAPSKSSQNGKKLPKISKTMWFESTEKNHYSLHLFSVDARLKQRPVGANVNLFSSLLAPNTYLQHRPYCSPPPRGFSSDYKELNHNMEPKILGCRISSASVHD